MKPLVDWVMWVVVTAALLLSYPFIFNRKDDDDL